MLAILDAPPLAATHATERARGGVPHRSKSPSARSHHRVHHHCSLRNPRSGVGRVLVNGDGTDGGFRSPAVVG
jgi:hypothetical protein